MNSFLKIDESSIYEFNINKFDKINNVNIIL